LKSHLGPREVKKKANRDRIVKGGKTQLFGSSERERETLQAQFYWGGGKEVQAFTKSSKKKGISRHGKTIQGPKKMVQPVGLLGKWGPTG